jgi:predicted LPLAT superfamily acyltransferase
MSLAPTGLLSSVRARASRSGQNIAIELLTQDCAISDTPMTSATLFNPILTFLPLLRSQRRAKAKYPHRQQHPANPKGQSWIRIPIFVSAVAMPIVLKTNSSALTTAGHPAFQCASR